MYKKTSHAIINSLHNQNSFQNQAINTIPIPPIIQTSIDWKKKFFTKIQEIISLIQTTHEKNINTLLVSTIENNSNYTLDIHQTTKNLINLIKELKNNQLIIIDSNTLHEIQKNLKLSNKNLTFRSINIKLGRYVNAKYILYSIIYNHSNNVYIKLELISIKNGEIIWSNTTSI